MHPAAKPKATGNRALKVSTNKNEGTATRGWGMAVKRVHSRALLGFIPLATKIVETAKPSGTLWSPIANVTKTPCVTIFWSSMWFSSIMNQLLHKLHDLPWINLVYISGLWKWIWAQLKLRIFNLGYLHILNRSDFTCKKRGGICSEAIADQRRAFIKPAYTCTFKQHIIKNMIWDLLTQCCHLLKVISLEAV